ncbi:MAG: CehA/McbA family metallohydrolase [Candidatus Latescibacteria bacterium]|nr:CehA/McbA family metallohydrolase [Candidatus Latescibacterota bacterium]
MPTFTSTYLHLDAPCRWLRGNHHGHSTVSDGSLAPLDLVRAYEAAGYQYLALSEHDCLLDTAPLQPATAMCLLPAVEVTSCFNQTLMHLGADRALPARQLTPRQIMEEVQASGGLFVFDHPNWKSRPDYATDELLDTMEGLRGMEIYCGVIERIAGQARATDRWDRLLSKGWRVFGHGTDDQHEPVDHFVAWNCAQWPAGEAPTASGIIAALGAGRFYASTGVALSRVGLAEEGRAVVVESDADEIHWVKRDGVIFKKVKGGSDYLLLEEVGDPGQALYVRAECLGRGNAMAFTQPFWIEA